jgi:hypothetical protein
MGESTPVVPRALNETFVSRSEGASRKAIWDAHEFKSGQPRTTREGQPGDVFHPQAKKNILRTENK